MICKNFIKSEIKLQLSNNYNIDEMILNHFKKFKFRDI